MDYEKLYRSFYMQVYSYVLSLTGDRDEAEEITQNTFVKAMSSPASYRKEASEVTWLCAIARNLYTDGIRARKRTVPLEETEPIPSDTDLLQSIVDTDAAFRIHVILHRLEEPYKEVFSLRVFGELSFAQIAAIFDKSEAWARVTYHRAGLKIRERMGGS
ncbi:MAG: RNA polymerase sigma factor [Clostridia bacterium]|nr:RNA polymerase sigma factor [Clostridia bacterium]